MLLDAREDRGRDGRATRSAPSAHNVRVGPARLAERSETPFCQVKKKKKERK